MDRLPELVFHGDGKFRAVSLPTLSGKNPRVAVGHLGGCVIYPDHVGCLDHQRPCDFSVLPGS